MKPELQPGVSANSTENTPSVYELTPEQSLVVDGVSGILRAMRAASEVVEATLPADHPDYPGGQLNIHSYYGFSTDHPTAGVWGLKVFDQLDARLHANPIQEGSSESPKYRSEYVIWVRGEDRRFALADAEIAGRVVRLFGLLSQSPTEKAEPNLTPSTTQQHGPHRILSAISHMITRR